MPGRPKDWSGPLNEADRREFRVGETNLAGQLQDLLDGYDLGGPVGTGGSQHAVVLLAGAAACADLAGLPQGRPSPAPGVPDLVAVVVRRGVAASARVSCELPPRDDAGAGGWVTSWSDAEHAAAVESVRAAIARGELYQANVVGHRSAAFTGDPRALAHAVAALQGATYGGVLSGDGWAIGCASPEQLVRVVGDHVTTRPVKGTREIAPGSDVDLRASAKDRAEHVMIVDLERNDLARVCRTGSVEVDELYALSSWSGLWHAGSTVSGRLRADVGVLELLQALAPGGSVTGAPKRAATTMLADLEPVGRGPSMGAFGFVHSGGLDLGLTIRTVALAEGTAHVWAGGGITWGSDADAEVAEAHAKARPVLAALSSP